MTTISPPPFFVAQLGEIVGKARVYGAGMTIRQIVASHPKEIGLSTLKTIEAGNHIRPAQLKLVAKLFQMKPLDWIETKIRYVEAYMREYLVPPSPANQDRNNIDPRLVNDFGALRRASFEEFNSRIHQFRLETHVRQSWLATNKAPLDVSDRTGGPPRKKDKRSVKYSTVTALCRGERIRPEKFAAICERLNLPRSALIALKIAYAEEFLNEYLLGDNLTLFGAVTKVDYPRTLALLIYSTQNAKELA